MKKLVILLFLSIILCHCTYFDDPSLNFFDKTSPPSHFHLTKVLGYKKLPTHRLTPNANLLSKTNQTAIFPYDLGKRFGDTLITYRYNPTKKCISVKQVFIKIGSEQKVIKWIKDNGGKVENITTTRMGKLSKNPIKKLTISNNKGQIFNCILKGKQLGILTVYYCGKQK